MRIVCQHCGKGMNISHLAFVTNRETVPDDEFPQKDYHPDPLKTYKTTEKSRRVSSAYYWRNKKDVLAREKRRREGQRKVSVSIYDGQ